MKKWIMVVAICLMVAGVAFAEPLDIGDIIEKIPALKQGIAYSLQDSDFNYLSTLEVAKWKGLTLEAGYSSKDKVVAVVSYELLKLKDYIEIPLLDLIKLNIGGYYGWGRFNMQDITTAESDFGISATLLNIKF